MRWRTRIKPPWVGERTRVVFSGWPVRCEDGFTRWLERIEVDEAFLPVRDGSVWGWKITGARPWPRHPCQPQTPTDPPNVPAPPPPPTSGGATLLGYPMKKAPEGSFPDPGQIVFGGPDDLGRPPTPTSHDGLRIMLGPVESP